MDQKDDQEGYYSSDDDVAWGPYTLREAKRDLRLPPLKIKYRHTDLGLMTAQSAQTQPKLEKLEVSDASAYFTPDESLAAHRNEAFLEKMEKVINDGEESRYASALDTTANTIPTTATPSGLSPILNNTNCYSINRLDSIQQTLVDNTRDDMDTVVVSSSDEDDDSHVLVISDTSDYSHESDPEILIKEEQPSHVTVSDTTTSDYSDRSDPVILIKEEQHSQVTVSDTTCAEEEKSCTPSSTSERSVGEVDDEVCGKNDVMMMGLNDTIEEMEMMLKYGPNYLMPDEVDHELPQNELLNTSNNEHLNISNNEHLDISNGSSSVSYISSEASDVHASHEAVKSMNSAKKQLLSSRESSDIMMLGLNDTIEEMEMMLKYGPNYKMPDEFSPEQNKSKSPQQPLCRSKVNNKNMLPGKYDYVRSPVAEYIKKNTPVQPHKFKIPETKTRPTPKFPQNTQFKDIMSPIKIYIKSPAVCLKKNVVGQVVSHLDLPDASVTSEEDADVTVSMDFPEVIYVPSKNVIKKTVKQQTLPDNIRKLVPTIEKHDKKTAKLKKEVITEKLLSEDLTNLTFSDPDLFENSEEQDISYVTVKYAVPK